MCYEYHEVYSCFLLPLMVQLGSGEECCNKYWPDDEETYEHISVKLVSSESYPKYSCRSFLLTNTKVSVITLVILVNAVFWKSECCVET